MNTNRIGGLARRCIGRRVVAGGMALLLIGCATGGHGPIVASSRSVGEQASGCDLANASVGTAGVACHDAGAWTSGCMDSRC
jgi:hypothetical protein